MKKKISIALHIAMRALVGKKAERTSLFPYSHRSTTNKHTA